nr:hypothetical protein [uncultured Alistipes sp.]
MEANKIKGPAKSVVLENGAELTYCERGEQNKDVIITTAFYFHTFMPIIEGLAERYHVYGIVMRFDGVTDQKNEDGTTHWGRQWGKDVYDFTRKMNIKRYIHVGKCHGTIPGWYMVKEHPDMMDCFASFYLAPHVYQEHGDRWTSLLACGDVKKLMANALRDPEGGLQKKMEEMASLGGSATSPEIMIYGGYPELLWNNSDALKDTLHNMTVPVGYCFGSSDPLFLDHYQSNMYAVLNTKGAVTTFLQGECHLMEIDSPERVVSNIFHFINETHKGFTQKILEEPFRVSSL